MNEAGRSVIASCVAALVVISLASCLSDRGGSIHLEYDGLRDRLPEVCVSLAIEAVGWSSSAQTIRASVEDDPASTPGERYLGIIRSDQDDARFEWVCELSTDADETSLTARLVRLDAM
ncbi:hypothetical protein [Agromyces sp. Marseille-Q5079]|uniref:hypothetical protein n=1 Tax=Agromyces sp. Marseille-Q5079 TaxID=3439059 RepID=UPI003D9C9B5F